MEFRDVVNERRAVDFFDPQKDVPEPLLREMIELAARAPSGFNLQPWSLVVLREKSEKERLRQHAWGQAKVSEAPVTIIVLADTEGWRPGHPFVEKNFSELVKAGMMEEAKRGWFDNVCQSLYGASEARRVAYACKNTGFFAMALMFAAKSLGLDTHPMDGFDMDKVREEFRIPERYWIPVLLAVGYFQSDKRLAPPKWRKTYDEIVVSFE
jgi:nitroreductase